VNFEDAIKARKDNAVIVHTPSGQVLHFEPLEHAKVTEQRNGIQIRDGIMISTPSGQVIGQVTSAKLDLPEPDPALKPLPSLTLEGTVTLPVSWDELELRVFAGLGTPAQYMRTAPEVICTNERARKFAQTVTGPGWRIFDKRLGRVVAWAPSRREVRIFIESERALHGARWGNFALIRTKALKPPLVTDPHKWLYWRRANLRRLSGKNRG
jgi:hypothetical protein